MASILAANVTYTEKAGTAHRVAGARATGTQRIFTLAFGDGALTYTTGGIALTLAKLGCTTRCSRLRVIAATPATGDNNPEWEWDGNETSPKLVGYGSDSANAGTTVPLAELAATIAFTAQSVQVEVEGY